MSFKKNYIIIFFNLSTFLFAGNSSLIYFDEIEFEMITNGFANKSYIHIHGDEEIPANKKVKKIEKMIM